jgi:two-component system, OmpR family, response regulator
LGTFLYSAGRIILYCIEIKKQKWLCKYFSYLFPRMDARKILIIDDEKDLCHLMTSFLKQLGYEVLSAYSLNDGLNYFNAMHPDILILDNNLPDGLGWENIQYIHATDPACKIILISANKVQQDIPDASISILEKPISLSMLQHYVA